MLFSYFNMQGAYNMYTELVMRTSTIENYINSIFRKYQHIQKMHIDYAEAFEIQAANRNIEYALKLLNTTHNSVKHLIAAEDKRESYRQKSYASMSHRQAEFIKFKESTDMLQINLTSTMQSGSVRAAVQWTSNSDSDSNSNSNSDSNREPLCKQALRGTAASARITASAQRL